jgi:hypothetical protein
VKVRLVPLKNAVKEAKVEIRDGVTIQITTDSTIEFGDSIVKLTNSSSACEPDCDGEGLVLNFAVRRAVTDGTSRKIFGSG